jgi:hypothetical protein
MEEIYVAGTHFGKHHFNCHFRVRHRWVVKPLELVSCLPTPMCIIKSIDIWLGQDISAILSKNKKKGFNKITPGVELYNTHANIQQCLLGVILGFSNEDDGLQ